MDFKTQSLFLFSIVLMVFFSLGIYFISDSFAIDFTDSTGYSASWAKDSGYQTVLLKCNEFSTDSRDGNWCNEWVAYVLDQGFENFPQSTSESDENISQKQTIASDEKFNKLRSFFDGFNDPQIIFQSEQTIDGVPDYTKAQLLRTYMNGEMIQRILVAETEQPTGEQQFFKDTISSLKNDLNNNPNKELVSWNSDDTSCSGYVADESNCVIQSDILGYYDTVGSTYSNGEFIDPKASCFVTSTIKISSGYTKSIWCIKGEYYVLQSTVWDKYISIQDISLTSHVIESIDTKYGYSILSPQDFLENPDVDRVLLSSNNDGLKKIIQTTVEVPKEKSEETPKTQQDCIDNADNLLETATPSTVTAILDNAFDDYLLCMENIGKSLGPTDPMYGFTSSQADKIQEIQDDCEYFAITKNTNNEIKMENELQKCRMQYIEIARETMKDNRDKSIIPPKQEFFPKSESSISESDIPSTGTTDWKTEESEITSQPEPKGGGCLIATATYGSELAPQVQQLRELRDNSLLQTASGTAFMKSFNQFYYSFSPTIADFERENPVFKEIVKIAITPMISTLSIMTFADDSEAGVLGFGISVILLNLGIYIVGPVFGISKLRSHIQRKQTSFIVKQKTVT